VAEVFAGDWAVEMLSFPPCEKDFSSLLFCGTPCAFDGAMWIDDEKFVVTGYSEIHPNQTEGCIGDQPCTIVPTLHVFDLADGTVTEYSGSEVSADVFFSADPTQP